MGHREGRWALQPGSQRYKCRAHSTVKGTKELRFHMEEQEAWPRWDEQHICCCSENRIPGWFSFTKKVQTQQALCGSRQGPYIQDTRDWSSLHWSGHSLPQHVCGTAFTVMWGALNSSTNMAVCHLRMEIMPGSQLRSAINYSGKPKAKCSFCHWSKGNLIPNLLKLWSVNPWPMSNILETKGVWKLTACQ